LQIDAITGISMRSELETFYMRIVRDFSALKSRDGALIPVAGYPLMKLLKLQ
jgi:hypothetical protein